MAGHKIPSGFKLYGINCGLKKNGRNDLGLFYSDSPCASAAVFTTNLVKSAPVLLSRKNIKFPGARAIIANSGCANACTGAKGLKDAGQMCGLTARLLGIKPQQVLVASTGVIGQYLNMEKVSGGIKKLCGMHASSNSGHGNPESAYRAIMTTDTVPKTSMKAFSLDGRQIRIWACAKGAGMIRPDMATFLCFIFTDCAISKKMLQKALSCAADSSFNVMAVDGDTSTNDTVFILANGKARNKTINSPGKSFDKFQAALGTVCADIAGQVVTDGEGATKFVRIHIEKAGTRQEAKTIAEHVALSPLVKTAIYGIDANWGRIISSVGSSGVKVDPYRIDIFFGSLCVCRNGMLADFSESRARKILNGKIIDLTINLNRGRESLLYYTCDMGYDYIKINASYRS